MYEKLNITENHLQVLSLFTNGYRGEYYIREVQRLLNISPRTAQLILDNLETKTILESKIRGKIKSYKIKKTEISRYYLSLTEQYKTISFLQKHPIVKEMIEKMLPSIDGIGIVFGSYAKGIERKGSDLDIFIAGKCDKKDIGKISEMYGIEISVKVYPLNLFKKYIFDDVLIKEVVGNHIIFLNAEQFVKEVFKHE